MALLDYTNALARLRVYVMDSGSAVWADADLQAALRIALGEASLYNAAALTLNGLDAAVTTTLPVVLESPYIIGAAGYAASARAVDRAEAFELVGDAAALVAWSDARLADWRAMLRAQYPNAAVSTDQQAARELASDTRLETRNVSQAARVAALVAAEAARVASMHTATVTWSKWTDDFGEVGELDH